MEEEGCFEMIGDDLFWILNTGEYWNDGEDDDEDAWNDEIFEI